MAAVLSVDYHYPFASRFASNAASRRRLELATSGGIQENPHFFRGRFLRPRQTAELLLALSLISRTRFFSPGELRERLLAAADPVVTSDGGQLRLEVFSVCCGAYARLDLRAGSLDGEWIGKGTTNVDFNPSMRAALATVTNAEDVALTVGADRVEFERPGHSVVERKVKLPVRWLKGFVEVQVYQSALKPAMELPGLELAKILRTLPTQSLMQAGSITYLVPAGRGARLSRMNAPGGVAVGAISRLKALEPILRHATSVRIYGNDEAVSAFELVLDEGSFTLVLSPNAARGFSGEGQALSGLAQRSSWDVLARVRGALVWQDRIDPQDLGSKLGFDRDATLGALQVLGARGLVGYDLNCGAFFHRQLPFDLDLVDDLHPRMKKARQLLEDGLRLTRDKAGGVEAYVKGELGTHYVKVGADGARCTCEWFAKNQGRRGPCSHMLAVELALQQEDKP